MKQSYENSRRKKLVAALRGSYSLPSNGKLEEENNYTAVFNPPEHLGYNYSFI